MLTRQADTSETQPSVPCSHSTYHPYLLSLSCSLQTSALRSVFHKPHMTGQTEMQAAETLGARAGEHRSAPATREPTRELWGLPSTLPRCCPCGPRGWHLGKVFPGAGAGHGAQSSLAPSKCSSQHRACVEARDANPGTRLLTPGLGCGPSTVTQ